MKTQTAQSIGHWTSRRIRLVTVAPVDGAVRPFLNRGALRDRTGIEPDHGISQPALVRGKAFDDKRQVLRHSSGGD